MAEEPTLPTLPKISGHSHQKRNRYGDLTALPSFSNSSDPAIFSSDDDPHIDNYANGRHRKKRYVGSWFQQMPASSDSTFSEDRAPPPKPKREFGRNFDSGVWMGSDEPVDPDDLGVESSPEPKFPQLKKRRCAPSIAPEELTVYNIIDNAIEDGNPHVDLSSLGISTIPDGTISRLGELALIPSVNRDVPFEQRNPKLGLYLSSNRLARAPGAIFNLEHLTYLSLRNNQISELPPSIGKLRNLRELNLSLNRLRYLPGELLELLKFPSALSLQIHPNPFFKPECRIPSRIQFGKADADLGDVLMPPDYLPLFFDDGEHGSWFVSQDDRSPEDICMQFLVMRKEDISDRSSTQNSLAWHVSLLARSPVQYSDSRGLILSKFHLPLEQSEYDVRSGEIRYMLSDTVPTEDLSLRSVPCPAGRASDIPSKASRVFSLFELAAKSASHAAQTWDLVSYLPPESPSSIVRSIQRVAAQSALNGNSGALPCSICGRQVMTPVTQWIEWWDITKLVTSSRRLRPWWRLEPLSLDDDERAIPFLKRGCSLKCTPGPMKFGQGAPGTLRFQDTT